MIKILLESTDKTISIVKAELADGNKDNMINRKINSLLDELKADGEKVVPFIRLWQIANGNICIDYGSHNFYIVITGSKEQLAEYLEDRKADRQKKTL